MTVNNGQQWEEVGVLQTDNVELKTKCNAMKDEINQLTSLLGKMTVNNENQREQIDTQSSTIETIQDENKQLKAEIKQLKIEVQQLKVSQWPQLDHKNSLYTLPNWLYVLWCYIILIQTNFCSYKCSVNQT